MRKNVNRANPEWLSKRAATIISDKDMKNVSSAFGEIRAYDELLWVWDDKVIAKKRGSDFQIDYYGKTILVEVVTQQHRTVRYMEEIESKTFTFDGKKVSSKIFEVFPHLSPCAESRAPAFSFLKKNPHTRAGAIRKRENLNRQQIHALSKNRWLCVQKVLFKLILDSSERR